MTVPDYPRLVGIDARGTHIVLFFRPSQQGPAGTAVYAAADLRQVARVVGGTADMIGSVDPTGDLVAVGDEATLTLYVLPTLAVFRSLRFTGSIQVIGFSPTGSALAVVDTSRTMTLLDRNGTVIMTARIPFEATQRHALAFRPQGDVLAIVGQVTGKSTLHLLPIAARNFDRELCRRMLDVQSPDVWQAVLPNDDPPPCRR